MESQVFSGTGLVYGKQLFMRETRVICVRLNTFISFLFQFLYFYVSCTASFKILSMALLKLIRISGNGWNLTGR